MNRLSNIEKHRRAQERGYKPCSLCGIPKRLSQFGVRNDRDKPRPQAACLLCVRVRSNDSRLRNTYGISMARYKEMVEQQRGLCALCGEGEVLNRRLSVDHDHVTGRTRKLLCGRCNAALGLFRDNPALLRHAAAYVEDHRG